MELIKLNLTHCKSIYEIDKSAFLDFWKEQNFAEELNTATRKYFGFESEGELVAFIGLDIVFDNCDIIRVAVHKKHQNKGIAKMLLLKVFELLKQKNIAKVMLEVSEKNEYAIKLYKNVGFTKIFERPKYYADGSDALIFELNL